MNEQVYSNVERRMMIRQLLKTFSVTKNNQLAKHC